MYLIIFIFFLFSSELFSKESSVYDVISNNTDLSIFKNYLDKTGLDDVLKKKSHMIGLSMLRLTKLLKIYLMSWNSRY